MPFYGRDWRSPGEQWVRTSEGWERMKLWRVKIFENLNENAVARIHRLSVEKYDLQDVTPRRQPYIYFNHGGSREKQEFTTLNEALFRLDMAGAVRDIRRANYVFQLMLLILKDKLPFLSGTSQKMVFGILESTMNEAVKTEINYGGIKDLLTYAQEALNKGHYSHIGSPALWSRHAEIVDQLSRRLSDYQLKERRGDGKIMLSDLPTDCLRVIFSQIADHKDVLRAGQTSLTMNNVAKEALLWKQMCLFHFTNIQILTFFPKQEDDANLDIDWEYIYRRCYKRFGKREIYTDVLAICSHCCSIHWKSLGHPCIGEESGISKILPPVEFLNLFKL